MKKFTVILFLLLTTVLVGSYTLLFTSPGNSVVASFIEDKANEQENVSFKVNNFTLTTSKINFDASIDNNSHIKINGDLSLINQSANLTYDVKVKDLSKLEKLINQKLNGNFNTNGTIIGDSSLMKIKGITDIFESATTYSASLVELEAKDINFLVKNAKIEKILYLVNQPLYAKGLININGKLLDMQGKVVTNISKGVVNNSLVNKSFQTKLKSLFNFKGDILTTLSKEVINTKVDFYTTMANIFVKDAAFKLDDSSLISDYKISIASLAKLYDVSATKMRGSIVINGEIKKDKDLSVTGLSNFLDGKINYKLLNDDFTASIKEVKVLKALHMLYYPEFFTSSSDLDLSYNLASKKGKLVGKLIDGQFLTNDYSTLINKVAQFDMTSEVYEAVNLTSDINKNVIKSVLDMKSSHTTITVPNSTVNLDKNTVSALVKTELAGVKFDTNISGDLNNPKVKVDTSELLSSTAKTKAKEKITEAIDKKLGGDAGNLLKSFFK